MDDQIQTVLQITEVQRFVDHFKMPPDSTAWDGTYVDCFDNKGKRNGSTPKRERAEYGTYTKALEPKTEFGRKLRNCYGLYFVATDFPNPSLYIGIASHSKKPEGILTRLRKHRVKVAGSHVGSSATNCGVNHTTGWRKLATERIKCVTVPDTGKDLRFTIGLISGHLEQSNHKDLCEYFEQELTHNIELRVKLIDLFWKGVDPNQVSIITSKTTKHRVAPHSPRIIFPRNCL